MDRLIFEKQSPFTKIQLFEDMKTGRITLALDGYVQFFEGKDEEIYHYYLTKPVIDNIENIKKIAILGGGDGLVARNLLKKNKNLDITLVDIDREVINLCRTHPRIKKINEGSLNNLNIIICDAKVWVLGQKKHQFDAVICDFPDPTTKELKKLYSKLFLSDVKDILKEDGIFSIQAGNNWITTYFNVKKVFGNAIVLRYKMPTLGEGQVISAYGRVRCENEKNAELLYSRS